MTSDETEKVVALPQQGPTEPETPPTPPGRLHGLSIAGMAVSALIGIVALFAYITINWPGNAGRYLVFAFVASGIGFLTCASTAVLTAARDTYGSDRSATAPRR